MALSPAIAGRVRGCLRTQRVLLSILKLTACGATPLLAQKIEAQGCRRVLGGLATTVAENRPLTRHAPAGESAGA
jgi:hypothetical protein